MPAEHKEPSYAERVAAMKQLRENIFLSDPARYAKLDIAEDLPGPAKVIGHTLKDVLPSVGMIEQDPEKRRAQIAAAVERFKKSRGDHEVLGKTMLHNALSMGAASLPISAALSGAVALLGARFPWARGKFQSPIRLDRLKAALSFSKRHGRFTRKAVLREALKGGAEGAGWAAASGALYPLLDRAVPVGDAALDEAAKALQDQPYLTSLPATEMVSMLHPESKPSGLYNGIIGTASGAATGAAAGITPALFSAAGYLLSGGRYKPKGGLLGKRFLNGVGSSVKNNALLGAASGGLLGAITHNASAGLATTPTVDTQQLSYNAPEVPATYPT